MPLHSGPVTIEAAHQYCRELAIKHYENFPVFLPLFSGDQKKALAAVYAFARTADDFADEAAFNNLRLEALESWRSELEACFQGRATHPVFVALRWTIERFSIEKRLFTDLLDAFVQDCTKKRYSNFEEVLDYCRRSANPVGRIVLSIFGISTPDRQILSDNICTALQLANFWQDISVDSRKDRIYIPQDEMARFWVTEDDIFAGRIVPGLVPLLSLQIKRTAALFKAGRPLIKSAPMPAKLYLLLVWLGGTIILKMSMQISDKLVHSRPKLGFLTVIKTWFKSIFARVGL